MLAKLWKKILLVICIVACIYNIMNKLVGRTSLEVQLKNLQEYTSSINSNTDMDNYSPNTEKNVENNEFTGNISDNNTIVVIY